MKKALARALALATIVTGSALAVPTHATANPGDPSHAVPSSIPDQCWITMKTSDTNGTVRDLRVTGAGIVHDSASVRLPYQPLDMAASPGGMGDASTWYNDFFATSTDGKAHYLTLLTKLDDEGYKSVTVHRDTAFGSSWEDSEDVTDASPFIYRLTKDGNLFRYTKTATGATGKTKVFGGGSTLRTMTHDRTISWNGGQADVLLSVRSDGQLREYIVPQSTPTKWTVRVLKSSTWGHYQELATAKCGTSGRLIMGHDDKGRIAAWYDRNRNDFSGADISGDYTDLPALPSAIRVHQ